MELFGHSTCQFSLGGVGPSILEIVIGEHWSAFLRRSQLQQLARVRFRNVDADHQLTLRGFCGFQALLRRLAAYERLVLFASVEATGLLPPSDDVAGCGVPNLELLRSR